MSFKNTLLEYDQILKESRSIFEKKMHDYGVAWYHIKRSTITDLMMIKIKKINHLQKEMKINQATLYEEVIGIINYSIIGILHIKMDCEKKKNQSKIETEVLKSYDEVVKKNADLLKQKNTGYQEAWRSMRISSIIDIILMKILRIQNIESKKGVTLISEGVDANYADIINYGVFLIILLNQFTKALQNS